MFYFRAPKSLTAIMALYHASWVNNYFIFIWTALSCFQCLDFSSNWAGCIASQITVECQLGEICASTHLRSNLGENLFAKHCYNPASEVPCADFCYYVNTTEEDSGSLQSCTHECCNSPECNSGHPLMTEPPAITTTAQIGKENDGFHFASTKFFV